MSTQLLFPSLKGLSWNYTRRVVRSSVVQLGTTGIETRIQYWTVPKYEITLNYEFLTDSSFMITGTSAVVGDIENIIGFYNQVGGTMNDFLYLDNIENTVTSQAFATGNGTTTQFQLARVIGGFAEPVYGPNVGNTYIYINGQQSNRVDYGACQPSTSNRMLMAIPPANNTLIQFQNGTVTCAAAGLVANQNYYVINSTSSSFQVSTTLNGNAVVTVALSGTIEVFLQPVSTTTVSSISNTGVVTFSTAPSNGSIISWTGNYYFRCRFVDDKLEFKGILRALWSGDSINLTTVLLRGST